MVFLEILGAALLLTIFGIGAWHIVKHFDKKEKSDGKQ